GGTEFPMMVMDGSASEGLILHEVGHQWLHGILANNEWKDGWLDEGFDSFTNLWLAESSGGPEVWQRDLDGIIALEQARKTQPIALPGKDFVDFNTYNAMTYTKAALVLRMLRDWAGDETTRRALRDYYERNRFRHVTEADLKASFERVGGWDLDWFFQQWLHTTNTLDYAVGQASTTQLPDGRWRSRIEVTRTGDIWMPVELQVGAVARRLESRNRQQVVYVDTDARPAAAVLDPKRALIDVDPANNRKEF
ncbi:MAG TPA: M1 family aminopeptidase, partial [Longimicrobiales bacterium]|nr:M1 family aminopeptidase [Longimicrobiales bacterium]